MKKTVAYCIFFFVAISAPAQYFLRGHIRDQNNAPLQNVKIFIHSSKVLFSVPSDGSFGFYTKVLYDTLTVSLGGYETQTIKVKTDSWAAIVLKIASPTVIKYKPKLISFTKNGKENIRFNPFINDETYFKLVENEFVKTDKFPNTGFSLNVNKASYSNVRRFINMQSPVPPDAVRIEEMINYFNLGYEAPDDKNIFKINSSLIACPWNTKNQLLFLKISAKKIPLENIPPGNFVFLIDVSGSMDMPNRLPLLKESFQLFVKNLRPIDKVSIVTYGGIVGTWLQPTNGDEKEKINNSLELLEAAGDTPGESAILAAYKLAAANFIVGGNNRVILATDGDFNVGQTSEKALDELITKQRETGIYLTCLGVGMGNFKDSKLQTLAKRGNGNYAYLDNLHEAEKVLVQELTETLYAVANNAYINIVFNATQINNYRLIGFDNKREAVQDISSEIEGGEIGSGASTLVIFEVVPGVACNKTEDFAKLFLKYNDVNNKTNQTQEIKYNIPAALNDTPNNCEKFAASVAMFGLKLKESPYLNNATWADVKKTVAAAVDKNIYLQNDFLKLVDRAMSVYEPSKRNKKNKKNKED